MHMVCSADGTVQNSFEQTWQQLRKIVYIVLLPCALCIYHTVCLIHFNLDSDENRPRVVSNANIFLHRSKKCRLHSTFSPILRPLSSPRVTMTRCDGPPSPLVISLCSTPLNLKFFLATFSRFRSVYSPALMHVYIPFFWQGVSLPRTYKILNGSATAGFDPL